MHLKASCNPLKKTVIMRHSIKIGLVLALISLTQLIYSNQTSRIKLLGINFYSGKNIEYNINDSIDKHGKIILNYKLAGRFNINYTVDSLSQLESTKYKIEGYDIDWIEDSNCKSIMLTNLDPAKYTIRIGIFEGENLKEEKNLNIIITPPIWKTWLFKFIVFLGFFGVFVIIIIVLINSNYRLSSKLKSVNK
jgi:hypothetical protein